MSFPFLTVYPSRLTFCAEFESVICFSLRIVDKNESCNMKHTFQTFSMILNSRPDLPAVKPLIDVFWNKWYQHTQTSILYHMEQEMLQVIPISEKNFKYTKKSSRTTQYHFH